MEDMFNPNTKDELKPLNEFDLAGIQNQVNDFQKKGLQSYYDIRERNSGLASIIVENNDGTVTGLMIHKIANKQGFFKKGTHWVIKIFFRDNKFGNQTIATVDAKTQAEALTKAGTEVVNYMIWREHNRQIYKPLNDSDMVDIQKKIDNDAERYEPFNDYDSGFYEEEKEEQEEISEEEFNDKTETSKIIIDCPNCKQKLRVVNGLSLSVTCPSCNHSFDYPLTSQDCNSDVRDKTPKSQPQETNGLKGKLKTAQKKIRNAWIAGLIYGSSGLIYSMILNITGRGTSHTYFNTIFYIFIVGLSFGIYKRSRTFAYTMFIMFLFIVLLFVFSGESISIYLSMLSIPFVILLVFLYFSFEGIRGTTTYHRLCYEEDSNYRPASKHFYFIGLPLLILPIVLYYIVIWQGIGILQSTSSKLPQLAAKRLEQGILEDKNKHKKETTIKPLILVREVKYHPNDVRKESFDVRKEYIYYCQGKVIYKEFSDSEGLNVIKTVGKIPDGIVWVYYPSGKLAEKSNYKDGNLDGTFKSYSESSNIIIESNYKDGKLDGIWKRYYESGELEEEIIFKNDKANGLSKSYYKNGLSETEVFYKNGECVFWKIYDEQGIFIAEGDESDIQILFLHKTNKYDEKN